MRYIYSTGIHLYAGAVRIASLKNPKAAKMIQGHKDVFDYLKANLSAEDRILWFHAASLGEFEQGRPLIEKIRTEHPGYKILLTFFSPSGYEIRKNYEFADYVCYLPFDTMYNAEKFVSLVKPEKVFFIKYEFWANYLYALYRRDIPVYLVSAIFRPTQIFFKPYGTFFRKLLTLYNDIFVQDNNSKKLLKHIGVEDAYVVGDTRFDRVLEINRNAKNIELIRKFAATSEFVIVAGSSWPKDEDILLEYFNNNPEVKLIIAPHEIHEEHIQNIISKLKRPYKRYSQCKDESEIETDCLIIDCIGLLSSIYRYGNMAYIGGGFGVGIHNILEAAVYGIPVVFGPNYSRFREAVQIIEEKGGFSIENYDEFKKIVDQFRNEPIFLNESGQKAGDFVKNNSGATDKILEKVFGK